MRIGVAISRDCRYFFEIRDGVLPFDLCVVGLFEWRRAMYGENRHKDYFSSLAGALLISFGRTFISEEHSDCTPLQMMRIFFFININFME